MILKPIPPTLRDKRRYLLIRGASWREVEKAVRQELGRVYRSLSGLKKIEETPEYLIIRVDRGFEWYVRGAIALHCGRDRPVFAERVSGTIKTIRDYLKSAIDE
jgi:RNase P/RNase MRP subunit POP5